MMPRTLFRPSSIDATAYGIRVLFARGNCAILRSLGMNTLRPVRKLGSGETVYEGYDTAQICQNGHSITRYSESHPEYTKDHCSECGSKTVTTCSHCEEKIRGHLHGTMPSVYEEPVVKFCHKCGKPYPWTEKGIRQRES